MTDDARSAVLSTSLEPSEPSEPLSALTLSALRGYRRRLADEEVRASYWRRLVHARIDLLEAESNSERPLGLDELVRVLGDTGSGRSRSALERVQAAEPLPELPVLAEMWVAELDPSNEDEVRAAMNRLHAAERQLTRYRKALHERLDAATTELIERYRQDPPAALLAFGSPHRRTPGGS